MERKKNDKRQRLVKAADELFHQQGVNCTTLANIASLAEVPLGNVYYYFKSKDSIIQAVIDNRKKMLDEMFLQIENDANTPEQKILGFVTKNSEESENTARFGDVLGSLCQELSKQQGALAMNASELIEKIISWCEKQFSAMGKQDKSRALAVKLVSSLQGLNLLTLSFKNPSFATEQAQNMVRQLIS